jgi:hypothetical protein
LSAAAVADDDDEVSPVIKPRRCIKRFFKLSIIPTCSFEVGNGASSTGFDFDDADLSCLFFAKLRICASNGFPPSSSSSPALPPDGCDSSAFDGGIKTEETVEGNDGADEGGGDCTGGGTDVAVDVRGIIAGISTGGGAGTE